MTCSCQKTHEPSPPAEPVAQEPVLALAEMHEPCLALAEGMEGQRARIGGLGSCAEPSGACAPRSLRIERATYREANEHEGAGFALETLSERELPSRLQQSLASRGRYLPCLPWVRVTRDPQRFTACLAAARRIGQIDNSRKSYELVKEHLVKEDQEVFVVILLDTQCYVRAISEVARGARDRVSVGVPDVLRIAVVEGATAMIIVHNHPSGNVAPSSADKDMTKAIQKAAADVGIPLMDHIIVGPTTYYSFANQDAL